MIAAPLSSVLSQREFKVGKLLITDTRFRLIPQNVEMFIWLNYNVHAVSYSTFSVFRVLKNKHKNAGNEYQLGAELGMLPQSSGIKDNDFSMETN